MTRYRKAKKLMQEYSISKREAKDYLRRASGDIDDARAIIETERFRDLASIIAGIDWEEIGRGIANALSATAEAIREVAKKWRENPEILKEELARIAKEKEDQEHEGQKEE